MTLLIVIIIGLIIGLVLGLTGAGGSIFAVPLLILLVPLPVNDAVGIAMGAVAITALYGTVNNWRYKSIMWIPAIILGSCGALLAPVGKYLGSQLPPTLLLLGFSLLAITVALRMWLQTVKNPEQVSVVRSGSMASPHFVEPTCRMSASGQFEWKLQCIGSLVFGGMVVGMLTGLFGVGGGFLIVPLLLFLSQVSMQQAVGTSLFIITVVSSVGFISFTSTSNDLDWSLLSLIALGGVSGMYLGHLIGHKIAGPLLQKMFSISLIAIVIITLLHHLMMTPT